MNNLFKYFLAWVVLALATYFSVTIYYSVSFSVTDVTGKIISPQGGEFLGILAVTLMSVAFGMAFIYLGEKRLR
jgi:hypothetical protein